MKHLLPAVKYLYRGAHKVRHTMDLLKCFHSFSILCSCTDLLSKSGCALLNKRLHLKERGVRYVEWPTRRTKYTKHTHTHVQTHTLHTTLHTTPPHTIPHTHTHTHTHIHTHTHTHTHHTQTHTHVHTHTHTMQTGGTAAYKVQIITSLTDLIRCQILSSIKTYQLHFISTEGRCQDMSSLLPCITDR